MSKSPSVSIRSKFEDDKPEEIFPEEYLRYGDVQLSRERVPNTRFPYEGYRDEKIRQLSKSRSGHIGLLTRIFNEICDLITHERGNVGDISSKYETFRTAWYKFIDVHENYFTLLESESDRKLAVASYDEQKERKLELDAMVNEWRDMVEMVRSRDSKAESKRTMSGSQQMSHAISNLSVISKKREEMAFAQLKLEELKIRQGFEEKEQQLKRMKELAEAEMKVKRAAVSLEIYRQAEAETGNKSKQDIREGNLMSPSSLSGNEQLQENVGNSLHKVVQPLTSIPEPTNFLHKEAVNGLPDRKFLPKNDLPLPNDRRDRNVPQHQMQTPNPSFEIYRPIPSEQRPFASGPFPKFLSSTVPPPQVLEDPNEPFTKQDVPHAPATRSYNLGPSRMMSNTRIPNSYPSSWQPPVSYEATPAVNVDMIQAWKQIANTPKLEYLRFDGDPMKYDAFLHNFENFLERDNPDEPRRLQLLIQHCSGKAREAIESCVSLSHNDGYQIAKQTLYENFGKPHVIAEAHTKKLMNLPNLKNGDGPSLLQFARHLETAERTLSGMGSSYAADLDHMHVLRELAKKLPMYLRSRWTEYAGNIFESRQRPRFEHFLKFIKERAKLVNNEFGRDMNISFSKPKMSGKYLMGNVGKSDQKYTSFAVSGKEYPKQLIPLSQRSSCEVCCGQQRIWNCHQFKKSEYTTKRRIVLQHGLCNKCLEKGHIARNCPKTHFKCMEFSCGKPHHTLMHLPNDEKSSLSKQQPKTTKSAQTQTGVGDQHAVTDKQVTESGSVATTYVGGSKICLGAVPVRVRGINGTQEVQTYALLDNGSEVTLCDERLAKKLNIDGENTKFTLTGINGSVEVESQLVDIVVMSLDGSTEVELQNVKTVKEIPISSSCVPRQTDLNKWPHLRDMNMPELEDGNIMLLIGLKERPRLFLPLEYKEGGDGQPIAIRYSLGWTVMGPVGEERESEDFSVNFTRVKDQARVPVHCDNSFQYLSDEKTFEVRKSNGKSCNEIEDRDQVNDDILTHQLRRLWNTDFKDLKANDKVLPSVEDERALRVMKESVKLVNGHFQVALPWRSDSHDIPNNKIMAERRLRSLKNRFIKDPQLFLNYVKAMQDYIDKGHAQKVPKEELNKNNGKVWYLPHHPVIHRLKPDKTRIVFDCAAKFKGESLNQHLLTGPDLANSLVGVIIRFRQEPIAVVADIESMFYQILVEPKDRDIFRFLWWEDHDPENIPTEYRMVKHVFGATSSPSIANFCVRKTASEFGQEFEPEVKETLNKNMYVDDLMKSVETTEKAIKLSEQLRKLLSRGGFRLTKWLSNDRKVLQTIPESERAKSVVNLEIDNLPTECALGMKWNVDTDKFIWEVREETMALAKQKPLSRRGMLSVIYSLFDPIGFIAPYIMKAKLLLQHQCRMQRGWDDEIEEQEKQQWQRWLADLPKLEEVNTDRCFKPNEFGEVKSTKLHIFCDGSRVGYGAVAYLRLENNDGRIHCSFVLARARLAPIREITIPRLELSAAVMAVQLRQTIDEELQYKVDSVTFWTDSFSVLKCIKNESKRFHTFESNRLTVIRNGSSVSEWRYVEGEKNPADDASKGLKLEEMLTNKRWLEGPDFLWNNEDSWPTMIDIPPLLDEDPEVRKESKIYVTTVNNDDCFQSLLQRYSSWCRLKRAVVWLTRYKQFLRMKVYQKKVPNHVSKMKASDLKVEELKQAERDIVRYVQLMSFSELVKFEDNNQLLNGKYTKKVLKETKTSLYKLNPMMKDGVLVVGGRLKNAQINEEAKHPIILPYKHPITDLIIKHYHVMVGHMGQESMLASLRERFWILKGRSAVRQVIRRCIDCQRRKNPPSKQFMADLPEDRIKAYEPPFSFVGIDYFGPLEVKQGRSRVKRYGCIFTCLNVRAVHIDIVHSLDTDAMINALRRFISLRGYPKEIRSDCGTNFTKADKELRANIEEWNQQKLVNFCTQKGIKWTFNPPSASHMGGAWERLIRSVRQILRALLKEQIVGDEVLLTVVAEVTTILNNRPLTRNSDDPRDEAPLTPNHLLHLRPCPALPSGVFTEHGHYKRRWKQAQYLANIFWTRWIKEYLPNLQIRQKWLRREKNIKIGDLVLLMDENYRRGQWPLARVIEVFPSEDGLVRRVNLKTSSTVVTRAKRTRRGEIKTTTTYLTRPVTKLCRLEMDNEDK